MRSAPTVSNDSLTLTPAGAFGYLALRDPALPNDRPPCLVVNEGGGGGGGWWGGSIGFKYWGCQSSSRPQNIDLRSFLGPPT